MQIYHFWRIATNKWQLWVRQLCFGKLSFISFIYMKVNKLLTSFCNMQSLIYRSEGKMQESLDKLQVCHELEPNNANTVKQIARSLYGLYDLMKLSSTRYKSTIWIPQIFAGSSQVGNWSLSKGPNIEWRLGFGDVLQHGNVLHFHEGLG